MRYGPRILAALTLAGCAGENAPHPPTASSPPSLPAPPGSSSGAFLWVLVVEKSGLCITGATVRVVEGEGAGQSIAQETPCDVWGYSGGVTLKDLTPGVAMILRASASGYVAQEKTVIPTLGWQQAVEFSLSRE